MAIPTRKQITALVKKARKHLDNKVYKKLAEDGRRQFRRVSDLEYKSEGKFINTYAISAEGKAMAIWEKVSTVTNYGYLEMEHRDTRGLMVPGMAMRSKADILVYVLWNEDYGRPDNIYFLNLRNLRKVALEAIQDSPDCLETFYGEGEFQVKHWRFNFSRLPADCFVTFVQPTH